MLLSSGEKVKFPGVYRRVKNNVDYFIHLMSLKDSTLVEGQERLDKEAFKRRMLAWCDVVSCKSTMDYDVSMDVLKTMFKGRINLYAENVCGGMISGNRSVVCEHCGKTYYQTLSRQLEGQRFREDDICPYCGKSNGSSLEWEFENRK